MKLTLLIPILLSLSTQSYAQDSLYAIRIDSIVKSVEDKIIRLGPNMFIRNTQMKDWYEEQIGDTINKNLLRVKIYLFRCDTFPISCPVDPLKIIPYRVDCITQSYHFYYSNNRLLKLFDSKENINYYVRDSNFIFKENNEWKVYSVKKSDFSDFSTIHRHFWFLNNTFIYHFKELLVKENDQNR